MALPPHPPNPQQPVLCRLTSLLRVITFAPKRCSPSLGCVCVCVCVCVHMHVCFGRGDVSQDLHVSSKANVFCFQHRTNEVIVVNSGFFHSFDSIMWSYEPD